MSVYLLCAVLFSLGLYCILRKRNVIKIIVGIIIAEYAVNLFFILSAYRMEPLHSWLRLQCVFMRNTGHLISLRYGS